MQIKLKYLILSLLLGIIPSALAYGSDSLRVKLGGAYRFNWRYNDWSEANKKQGGAIVYDMARLNMSASYGRLKTSAEFRYYAESSGGGILKNGWIGYDIDSKNRVRFGLTSVPYGILPFQSNSYFLNINYYIGLEDDDDLGIAYQYLGEHVQLDAAFFKNSDLLDGEGEESSAKRYSYDLGGRTKEINTGVVRIAYKGGDVFRYEVGISGYIGQAYNIDSGEKDARYSYAGHAVFDWKRWNIKTQITRYNYSCSESKSTGYVTMTAFNAPYFVCDKGNTVSFCLAYSIPVLGNILDGIKVYNDYSHLFKAHEGYNDSQQNILGCCLSAGPMIIYFDWVFARNHSWIGPDWNGAFAQGADNKWHSRINLNVGIYF